VHYVFISADVKPLTGTFIANRSMLSLLVTHRYSKKYLFNTIEMMILIQCYRDDDGKLTNERPPPRYVHLQQWRMTLTKTLHHIVMYY